MRRALRNEYEVKKLLAGQGAVGRQTVAGGKERDGKVRVPVERMPQFGGKRLSHADPIADNHDTATRAPA